MNFPKTLKELKKAGYQHQTIQDELRKNLLAKLESNTNPFEGIHGFENTVIPALEHAIISGHHINLLGLRGQAKTKIARLMIELLDDYIPYIQDSPIYDDPFQPISNYGKKLLQEHGDDTPIQWLAKEDRYYEKLATPDVSIADLIGDIDPIKAAQLKLSYSDEQVIHYGMIPRANRCIFVINELPDLQAKIQVALFNILQEGDIQIRGFKLRLPLDIQFVFTANPEDYTNRGSIVTPLKDRIGSQILTHYPKTREIAKRITQQEAQVVDGVKKAVSVPDIAFDLLEQISFEARESEYVDAKSGISARLSISALENLYSTAFRRMTVAKETETSVRLLDFMGIVPAITGKIELVYEGESEGADQVAEHLIESAAKSIFLSKFPAIKKLEKAGDFNPYAEITDWFGNQNISLLHIQTDQEYQSALDSIAPLDALINKFIPKLPKEESYFWKEVILWSLVSYKKLNKEQVDGGLEISDLLGTYLKHF